MAETNLNISVTVADGVENLKQLEAAIKAQRAAWKDAAIGSQEYTAAGQKLAQMLDQKNELTKIGLSYDAQVKQSYFSMGEALRVQTVGEKGLTDVIRSARQDRRMYMFAIRETETALTSVVGKESAVTSAMTTGAQAVFGMKFALEAMGVAATAAWPVAIIVAAWSVISGILASQKKDTEDLNAVLRENLDLEIKLGRIAPEAGVGADVAQLAEEKRKLANLQKTTTNYRIGLNGQYSPVTTTVGSPKEIADQINLVDKLQLKVLEGNKKIADENGKELDEFKDRMDQQIANEDEQTKKQQKSSDDEQKAFDKKRAALIEEQDYQHAMGALSDAEYLTILKIRWAQDDKVKSRKEELAVMKQIEALQEKHPELSAISLSGELAGKSYATGSYGYRVAKNLNPGAINPDQFGTIKSTEQLNAEANAKLEASATNKYLIEPMKSGFQSMAYSTLEGFNRMWEQSSGFARTVLGQALESIADKLISNVEDKLIDKATTGLLALLGLSCGGDIQYAASGGTYRPGSSVIVGERGPEMLLVGNRGTRVIPNSQITQMGMQTRGGGDIASAIQDLANKITPASASEVHYAMIKQSRLRGGRKM
jgi:hypothetical protein